MKHPTFLLLLDFAKYSVWPFHDFRDHQNLLTLIKEMKLKHDSPLDAAELTTIFVEYKNRFRTKHQITAANIDGIVSLVLEMRQQFGNSLTGAARADLYRAGKAPKSPRNSIAITKEEFDETTSGIISALKSLRPSNK